MVTIHQKTVIGLFLTLLFLLAANTNFAQITENQSSKLLIHNGNIINIKNGEILYNHSIVVSDGVIESIMPATNVKLNSYSIYTDANGKFVIPGIWDMHAHMRADNLPPFITTEWMMPLLIANGVTGVRDMTSSCQYDSQGPVCLDQMRKWQNEIESGKLLGPRLLALSSYQINPDWNYQFCEQEARALVHQFSNQNLDLIKIYFRLSPKAYSWIIDESEKLNIDVGGHIPIRMSVIEASEKGLRSLEHARDLLFDCYPESNKFRKEAKSQDPSVKIMHQMVDEFDENILNEIFEVMIKNNTWYVPTHVTRRMEAYADDPNFRNDFRNEYIPEMLLASWLKDADNVIAMDSTKNGRDAFMKFYKKGLEITANAHKSGVRILLGTDGGDTFVYPGFSVHDELQELVLAGLTPLA
ncbi:MAG: hypothetical protein DSY77_16790, partial [Bacteroidetes bacterium]